MYKTETGFLITSNKLLKVLCQFSDGKKQTNINIKLTPCNEFINAEQYNKAETCFAFPIHQSLVSIWLHDAYILLRLI